jgi:hypothetical protein
MVTGTIGINMSNEKTVHVVKPGTELEIPRRHPFSKFPFIRIVKVVKDGKESNTEYWPSNSGQPSNRHTKTIRLFDMNWKGIQVKGEYNDITKIFKLDNGDFDSVTIEIA